MVNGAVMCSAGRSLQDEPRIGVRKREPVKKAILKMTELLCPQLKFCVFFEDEVDRDLLRLCANCRKARYVKSGKNNPWRVVGISRESSVLNDPLDGDAAHGTLLLAQLLHSDSCVSSEAGISVVDRKSLADLGSLIRHEAAAKALWPYPSTIAWKDGDIIKPKALIVDDRVTDEGSSGYAFCIEAAHKLESLKFCVFLTSSLPRTLAQSLSLLMLDPKTDALVPMPWTHASTQTFLRDMDIIFLDIVDASSESEGWLAGIQRDLFLLNGFRQTLSTPLICMLTNMRRELIAHLASTMGADYYFQKHEFLQDLPLPLGNVLEHLVSTSRGRDIRNLRVAPSCSKEDDSWAPKRLGAIDDEAGRSEAETARSLAYQLYGQKHDIDRVELLGSLKSGMSGAKVLRVQPHSAVGEHRTRVMKVASRHQLALELDAYARLIHPYVSAGFTRIDDQWAVAGPIGAISYELAENPFSAESKSTIPFEDYLPSHGVKKNIQWTDAVLKRLHVLHHRVLNDEDASQSEKMIWRFFQRELYGFPVDAWPADDTDPLEEFEILDVRLVRKGQELEARVASLGPVRDPLGYQEAALDVECLSPWLVRPASCLGPEWLLRPGRRFRSRRPGAPTLFVSAVNALEQALEELDGKANAHLLASRIRYTIAQINAKQHETRLRKLYEKTSEKKSVQWGIVHGDLHAGNFLVDTQGNFENLWVIDFGKTRKGPTTIDYVCLESSIRERMLYDVLGEILRKKESAEDWYNQLSEAIDGFEDAVENGESSSGPPSARTTKKTKRLEHAVALVKKVREIYRENHTCPEAYRHYALTQFLFATRAMQGYCRDAAHPDGPIRIVWAHHLAERTYKQLMDA